MNMKSAFYKTIKILIFILSTHIFYCDKSLSPADLFTATLEGTCKMREGDVPGAAVTFEYGGKTYSDNADDNGFYQIKRITVQEGTSGKLSATKYLSESGITLTGSVNFTLEEGTNTADITLIPVQKPQSNKLNNENLMEIFFHNETDYHLLN